MAGDLWTEDVFGIRRMQEAVEKLEPVPMQISSMGLFESKPLDTDQFSIDIKNGIVTLVPFTERHAVPQEATLGKDESVPFKTGAFLQHRQMWKDEILRFRALGTVEGKRSIESRRDEYLKAMMDGYWASIELLRLSCLNGILRDKNGNVLNLWTRFGIAQPAAVPLNLTTADNGVLLKAVRGLVRDIIKTVKAPVRGIHAICGEEFFEELIANPEVRKSYNDQQNLKVHREGPAPVFGSFHWGGIDWEESKGWVGEYKFVDDDKARIFPKGVPGMYRDHWAPAPTNPNELGRPYYSRAAEDPLHRKWIDMEVDSYPMPVCTRIEALRTATIS